MRNVDIIFGQIGNLYMKLSVEIFIKQSQKIAPICAKYLNDKDKGKMDMNIDIDKGIKRF